VAASVEVDVDVAFHLSNVPSLASEAFTWNLIEPSSRGIAKTGTDCARLARKRKKEEADYTKGSLSHERSDTAVKSAMRRCDCAAAHAAAGMKEPYLHAKPTLILSAGSRDCQNHQC
jgi:hypothetical protein